MVGLNGLKDLLHPVHWVVEVGTHLQHVEQPLPAAFLHAVLVHQDAAQVEKTGVLVGPVDIHHLWGDTGDTPW